MLEIKIIFIVKKKRRNMMNIKSDKMGNIISLYKNMYCLYLHKELSKRELLVLLACCRKYGHIISPFCKIVKIVNIKQNI